MFVDNRTPFHARPFVIPDRDGRELLVVVVKASFTMGRALEPSEEQAPIALCDSFRGEVGRSSIEVSSDVVPFKPGTDVLLGGHAYPEGSSATSLDASLRVGPVGLGLRVVGDRVWERSPKGIVASAPAPFERMPLVYERATCGDLDGAVSADRVSNPLGRDRPTLGEEEGASLPNIEDALDLVTGPLSRPAPVGFGALGPGFTPRAARAGTCDASHLRARAPLLPGDFDERFFHAAHPRLICSPHLRGDEKVAALRVSQAGPIKFVLPGILPMARIRLGLRGSEALALVLDTVSLFPDERRVDLVWRGRRAVHADLLDVTRITVEHGVVS